MARVLLPIILGAVFGAGVVYVWSGSAESGGAVSSASDDAAGRVDPVFAAQPAAEAQRDAGVSVSTVDDNSFLVRAEADPDAVLLELAGISPPGRQREAALAVLAALGYGDAAIARIEGFLPQADRLSFRIDALSARAQTDPGSALRSAMALGSSGARSLAISRIGEVAAAVDVELALANAALINEPETRQLYLKGIAESWAVSDATAALVWLESVVPNDLSAANATSALDNIAAEDHEFLLGRVEELSPVLRSVARHAAVVALAEHDPEAALAEVEALGSGFDTTDLAAAVARQYALENPEAAVSWAQGRLNSQTVLEAAFIGAASVDYELAVDLALQVLETEPVWSAFALGESGAGPFSLFVDRLFESDIPDLQQKFNATMVQWPQVDAEAALRWTLENISAFNGRGFEINAIGRSFLDGGRDYPDLAISGENRITAEFREHWIEGVAQGVAAADPERALQFVERFRGEPGFDSSLDAVVRAVAEYDPLMAADLVERTGANAAGTVGWAWSQQDPVAASNWVANLDDPNQRRDGVVNLAGNWSRREPAAAVDWILELPPDQTRDSALQMAIPNLTASTGSFDAELLEAIQDPQVRDRAAMNAVISLGRSDVDEARRLAEIVIENPNTRQQALQRIAEQGGGIVSLFSSSIDVPR